MNASYLQTLADEANEVKRARRALPLQLLMTRAEREARAGDYYCYVSEHIEEEGFVIRVDLLSEEDKAKCIARGFWFDKSYDYFMMRWDKKPWWRFWE